jgi:hypothetical protein
VVVGVCAHMDYGSALLAGWHTTHAYRVHLSART